LGWDTPEAVALSLPSLKATVAEQCSRSILPTNASCHTRKPCFPNRNEGEGARMS